MEEFSMPQSILQIVSEKGFDGLREIMQILFIASLKPRPLGVLIYLIFCSVSHSYTRSMLSSVIAASRRAAPSRPHDVPSFRF